MENIFYIAIALIALTFLGHALLGFHVLWKQRHNVHHKTNSTFVWFCVVFLLSSFSAVYVGRVLELDKNNGAGIGLLFILGIVNLITLVIYYKEVGHFSNVMIPESKVEEIVEEKTLKRAKDFIDSIENSKMPDEAKVAAIKEAEILLVNHQLAKKLK